MRRLAAALAVWLAAAGVPAIAAQAQDSDEAQAVSAALNTFTGNFLVLRSYGDSSKPSLDFRRLRMGNDCDLAVDVLRVLYRPDLEEAEFDLEPLGRLNVGGRIPLCGPVPRLVTFTVENVRPEEDPRKVVSVIGSYLMTPEAYLAERGVGFELVEDEEGNEVVRPQFTDMDMREARAGGDCWLVVYPQAPPGSQSEDIRKGVRVRVTIGVDAALHDPEVLEAPGERFRRQALRALEMWRCEPTVEEGELTPVRITIPVRFRGEG